MVLIMDCTDTEGERKTNVTNAYSFRLRKERKLRIFYTFQWAHSVENEINYIKCVYIRKEENTFYKGSLGNYLILLEILKYVKRLFNDVRWSGYNTMRK